MSTLSELLSECHDKDIRLFPAVDGGLNIDAPANTLTPSLLAQLKDSKAQLLASLQPEELGPDGWPVDSIHAEELAPCSKCNSLDLWQTLSGSWRCMKCDPPTLARRLAAQADRIRQSA